MYLINVSTLKLEFFQDDRNRHYAILSHRWQEEEILFQDLQSGGASQKKGYAKLKRFCQEAATAGYDYAWCDTCCIDKDSSAELSESINSMFRWYQNAGVCFTYLFDLTASTVQNAADMKSEWFSRGWCLQELIAPKDLVFFNANWEKLGSRNELQDIVHQITGIHSTAFGGDLEQYSIAQRMSWAADRETTRAEDKAYSLLGIFGVNMPLLYGEGGERAFLRLQDEIMKQSSDQSILVHSSSGADKDGQWLMARSPADFRESSSIVTTDPLVGEPSSLTNVGLSITLRLYPWDLEVYAALLDCRDESTGGYVNIWVQQQPPINNRSNSSFTADHVTRIKVGGKAWASQAELGSLPCLQLPLYLGRHLGSWNPHCYGFFIRSAKTDDPRQSVKPWVVSHNDWDEQKRIVSIPQGTYGTAAIIACEFQEKGLDPWRTFLRVGFTDRFIPAVEMYGGDWVEQGDRGLDKIYILGPNSFSREHDGVADQSITKEQVLSSCTWIYAKYQSNRTIVLVEKAVDRSTKFRKRYQPGMSAGAEIRCEKMLIDGLTTWTLDIRFLCSPWDMPEINGKSYQGADCDGCDEPIYGKRYKCSQCSDYDLCENCLANAKEIHNPEHQFHSVKGKQSKK